MTAPMISAVMPVFNGARYLKYAIESILAQTYRNFELIIVNDGSTDKSAELIGNYASCNEIINFISYSGNRGCVSAMTLGLAQAKGKFVTFADCDDVSSSDRFEKQIEHLTRNQDLVLLGSNVAVIDPFGNSLQNLVTMPEEHNEIVQLLLTGGWPIVQPTTLIRREAIEAIGGIRSCYGSHWDHDMFLRLSEIGKLGNLPKKLYSYRLHFNNQSHSLDESDGVDASIADAVNRTGIARPKKPTDLAYIGKDFYLPPTWTRMRLFWAIRHLLSGEISAWSLVVEHLKIIVVAKWARTYSKIGLKKKASQ